MPIRDYTLLAAQPVSVKDLAEPDRDAIVISAIVDERGQRHVLSRFGDSVWELWPFFEQANRQASKKRIDWSRFPEQFRDSIKATVYGYWTAGTPGFARPSASTVVHNVSYALSLLRYLDNLSITSLCRVQPLHIHNFLHERRTAHGLSRNIVKAIGMLYRFRGEHSQGLSFDPWLDESLASVSGFASHGPGTNASKTPLIPRETLSRLFAFAEKIIQGADALLDERDAGKRSATNDAALNRVRNACFFLIGLLTGMRCEEIAGIEVNAGRTEIKEGVTFHWIRSIEHKTKKGRVEYLMPSMGHSILRTMERWSQPLRARLVQQLAAWEADGHASGHPERLQSIAAARADVTRLFLGLDRKGGGIRTISGHSWLTICRQFACAAQVEWPLAPHQLRRTYAWTFVRHRLGNLLFLKEQFKHSSMEMTQLYAANPQQDPRLYDEIVSELRDLKVELIQHWLSDGVKLSGGAGRKIVTLRANAFANRNELIEDTAESVHIRSNGHAWCLAQDDGCGGAGLYERTRCADCSSGCIDESHALMWKEIYAHQLELVEDAKELGPGAQQRVERDRKVALKVLTDLGIMTEDEPK